VKLLSKRIRVIVGYVCKIARPQQDLGAFFQYRLSDFAGYHFVDSFGVFNAWRIPRILRSSIPCDHDAEWL
jgi:hypothetical protein